MSYRPRLTKLRRMVRLVRLPLLVVVLALLAALVAGCGGGQGAGSVALPVLQDLGPVAEATGKADSARFEMTFELGLPDTSSPLGFSMAGAYDTPAGKAEMTMDLGSLAELVGGFAGSLGGGAPSELADPGKWKLELRLDGTVAYMRLPFLAGELPEGKEWVELDLGRAAEMQGLDLAELRSFAQGSDPREALDYLRSIAGELTRMGTEDVRGVPTVHYFAVVDWQKALARAAREANQAGLFDQLQSLRGVVQNIPVDVWVDADMLVRRMKMDLSASSGVQQASAAFVLELFDYGQPVDVEAPPAADVVDAFSLRD